MSTSASRPRIGIVGAGAVGSLLAALLGSAGVDVVLVDRRAGRGPDGAPGATRGDAGRGDAARDAAGSGPLVLVTPDGTRRTVTVTRVPDVAALPAGLAAILLATKQFDLPGVLDALASRPDTPLVTAQNGVGAEDLAAARRPGSPLAAASLTAAVELGPDRAIRWLRTGGIGLATVTGAADAVAILARAFTRAGLRARVFGDPVAMKWSKLVANLVGNATSAVLDLDPAAIYADPTLFRLERSQLTEAGAVMRALGVRPVRLPGANVPLLLLGLRLPEPLARRMIARSIGGARGGKSPSLRLHLRGGGTGPTEARWLNGAVAGAGARLGVPVPVNARLVELVDRLAADPVEAAAFRGRPDRLLAVVAGRDRAV